MMSFCFQADGETAPVEVKTEVIDDTEPTPTENSSAWSILHDDFMIGTRMKDWDKETSGHISDNMPVDRDRDSDDDDSDDDDEDDDYS